MWTPNSNHPLGLLITEFLLGVLVLCAKMISFSLVNLSLDSLTGRALSLEFRRIEETFFFFILSLSQRLKGQNLDICHTSARPERFGLFHKSSFSPVPDLRVQPVSGWEGKTERREGQVPPPSPVQPGARQGLCSFTLARRGFLLPVKKSLSWNEQCWVYS